MASVADKWISVGEAAKRLGLSDDTIRRRCDEGKLRYFWTRPPDGGQRRISPASVEAYRREMYGGQ